MSTPREDENTPWVDPIVAEVHVVRAKLVAAANGDLHALCEQLRAHQRAAGRISVPHAPRRPGPETGQAA